MKLSLIIAIYNIEYYIEDCIKSLVSQDLSQCEVLLVDDGSTDASGDICKKYELQYKNLKYLHKPNGGVGSARNYGLNTAQGEYIWFIDGDDEVTPSAIQELLIMLKTNVSDAIMFYTLHKRINENFERLESDMLQLENYHVLDFIKSTKIISTAVWTFAFNRSFLIENNLLFEDRMYYEDNHFMYQVYNTITSISSINKALYIYKAREGSLTKKDVYHVRLNSMFQIIQLLHNMKPKSLNYMIIKNLLFSHIKEYIILNSKSGSDNLSQIFMQIPRQRIYFKDSLGVIYEKLFYNLNKKLYVRKVLNQYTN